MSLDRFLDTLFSSPVRSQPAFSSYCVTLKFSQSCISGCLPVPGSSRPRDHLCPAFLKVLAASFLVLVRFHSLRLVENILQRGRIPLSRGFAFQGHAGHPHPGLRTPTG